MKSTVNVDNDTRNRLNLVGDIVGGIGPWWKSGLPKSNDLLHLWAFYMWFESIFVYFIHICILYCN